jgi:hypothetical protein
MAVKEAKANKSFELNRCTLGVQYGNTVRQGITCFTEKMQMFIFPKNEHAKLATLKDNYSKQQFRPVECNGRPAVYFEGEKTHIFYVPEIPENPLDRLNDQLILLQVLFHEGKKWYGWCKNFFREKTKQSQLQSKESAKTIITNDIKISWKESLDDIEKQLNDINTVAGETVDWRWINNILEDRREELDVMNHSSKVNLETINTFTENLQALQAELVEISKDFALTVKQGGEFVCQTHNANRLTYKHYESNVLLSCNTNTSVIPCGFFKGQCFKKEYNDNHKFHLSNNLL